VSLGNAAVPVRLGLQELRIRRRRGSGPGPGRPGRRPARAPVPLGARQAFWQAPGRHDRHPVGDHRAREDRGTVGGFNWLSQHLEVEVWRWVCASVRRRSVPCVARCGRLGGRRRQGVKTGSGSGKRLRGGCRARTRRARLGCRRRSVEVVPSGWRDATDLAGFSVRPLFVLCRAGGDRSPARPACWGESDRPTPGPGAVDDLAGAAPQRFDAYLSAGVSGVDGAVARAAACESSQGRQARGERSASRVRAGSSRRRDHPTRWRVAGRP
jgi:hypothetical protein